MRIPENRKIVTRNKLLSAFPTKMKKDVEKVLEILYDKDFHLNLYNEYKIIIEREEITIPYRIYFKEPLIEEENKLTEIQKVILNCLYSRHSNGYIRQNRLELLKEYNQNFVIPYKFQLLGEYVKELLEALYDQINENSIEEYFKFMKENKEYTIKTKSRMVSYWNVYYRFETNNKLNNYIGKKIFNKLEKRYSI